MPKSALFFALFLAFLAPIPTFAITTSKAEGVDRTVAAKAESWSGLIIGINEGEKSLVITEAPKLDHISAYAQRSILVNSSTTLVKNNARVSFDAFDIGEKVVVTGIYNAGKRIITARSVTTGKNIASVATKISNSSVTNANDGLTQNLHVGSRGADVVRLQNYLVSKGFLKIPAGTAYGLYGAATKKAVQTYQKSVGLPITGGVGPMTRAKING
ncbi:MAG: peptidoglycan-binding domain-containing protein [Candidatus Magasanikbacteria bacterium]|nr:peptidoglycan-binding domain-containing protein [Candidatus Magasanikbacteria bacterium]